MIVCSCNVFSDHQLRSAVAKATQRPRMSQIYGYLGGSPQCGQCAHTIKRMIERITANANLHTIPRQQGLSKGVCREECSRATRQRLGRPRKASAITARVEHREGALFIAPMASYSADIAADLISEMWSPQAAMLDILAGAASPYHAAGTRRVSAAWLAPTSGQVVT
jgi:bacterioferritin-associated ferredoxin